MSSREVELPEGMSAHTAVKVLERYVTTEDATIVPGEMFEELQEAKAVFAKALEDSTPQSADVLASMDMAALTEPFRDDDGELAVDTLTQSPETRAVPTGGADTTSAFDPETLSLSEREKLQQLRKKVATFRTRGVDKRADTLEAEMADLAAVDDVENIDWEQL